MSDIGHNSNSIDGGHLRAFIERIEGCEQVISAEQEARRMIYAEAKSDGYDPKMLRKVVALRKQDAMKRKEEEEILDLYLTAIGMT